MSSNNTNHISMPGRGGTPGTLRGGFRGTGVPRRPGSYAHRGNWGRGAVGGARGVATGLGAAATAQPRGGANATVVQAVSRIVLVFPSLPFFCIYFHSLFVLYLKRRTRSWTP